MITSVSFASSTICFLNHNVCNADKNHIIEFSSSEISLRLFSTSLEVYD